MPEIKIDDQVFAALQALAKPFVDEPNDVIRRLLAKVEQGRNMSPYQFPKKNPARFYSAAKAVQKILAAQFSDSFSVVRPYRLLFEGQKTRVYFQNFVEVTGRLWFTLNRGPWGKLASAKKQAFLCLTCPAMGFAYLIPYKDLRNVLSRHPELRKRDKLAINIKVSSNVWTELEWNIKRYRIEI